jgi:hypothetical protein
MSLVEKLFDCVNNNIFDKANDIIKNIIKNAREKKENNPHTCQSHDEKIKNIIILWLKENIYKSDDLNCVIYFYVIEKKIFKEEQIIELSKFNELWIVLCEEIIFDILKCNDRNMIEKLFNCILDKNFIPNEEQFINIINNYNCNIEYTKILSTKDIMNTLRTKYKTQIFESMTNTYNFNKNIYDLVFLDPKYNENEIKMIFKMKSDIISHILTKMQLEDDVKFDEKYFGILMFYNIFSPISNLIKNNFIINHDKCFNLFWRKIEKCAIVDFSYIYTNSDAYIFKKDIENIINIYKTFNSGEYGNYIDKNHFDIFFKRGWISLVDFLIKEKNIFPEKSSFESYIINIPDDKRFQDYFPEIDFTENELYLACLNKRVNIIKIILEQKIIPTQRCFRAIFEKYNNNVCILGTEYNNIKTIIDNFIHYSYYLNNEDILFLTKKRFMINDSFITRNLKFNDIEKEEFYSYCDIDFIPKYNDSLFNDILWLRRMCKTAKRIDDYKFIKNFIKRTKIEMDLVCYIYMMNNNNNNKIKDELMITYRMSE